MFSFEMQPYNKYCCFSVSKIKYWVPGNETYFGKTQTSTVPWIEKITLFSVLYELSSRNKTKMGCFLGGWNQMLNFEKTSGQITGSLLL
jgi:hypothetical protein